MLCVPLTYKKGLPGSGSLPVEVKLAPTLTLFPKTLKMWFCQRLWGPQADTEPKMWLI